MFSISRKALTAALLATALVATLSAPSFADKKGDLERQKRGVSGQIGGAKEDLDHSSEKYATAVSVLKAAQKKLAGAEAKLGQTRGALAVAQALDEQMQAKLAASEADLAAAIAKLKKGAAQLAKSEGAVEQFTVENLQQGDRGMRAFSGLLRGDDPTTFTEEMNLNDSVSDAQVATMQNLAATKVILKLDRRKVRALRDRVAEQRRQAAANLVSKQNLEASAERQAAVVGDLVATREKARGSAAVERRKDEVEYRKLVRERESLSAKLRALAAQELARKRKRGGGGSSSGGDGGGTLSYPVNGPITSSYGMRVHPVTGVYKLHDGTDFGVGCGTPVRAAASGTIIQQYYNGGYGNRIILANGIKRGKSVVTTYNHLSGFARGTGSRVSRGQVIGYVGSTGYSTGCHLHFMVITNGYTVNPAGWL
ncbi:peptidoglycan DD-metalloendopeptidase family protein [Aeromicrobium sp.]|uniref:peptidoglycan DD-metalloendopeptidase family protein n=1 Tax=Aeromicrobium sp. TaxID=1871063 RepID=UPI003C551CEF